MNDLKRPDLSGHYDDVIDSLKCGRLIPFLGAGVNLCGRDWSKPWDSKGNTLPSGGELAEHLAGMVGFPVAATACPAITACPATATPPDLLQVAQYLIHMKDEQRLFDELHDLFDKEFTLSPVHIFLASLPAALATIGAKKPHMLVVTTNYDDLMERAFDSPPHPEPYDLVFYDARSASGGKFLHRPPGAAAQTVLDSRRSILPIEQRSIVFKMHGAVARNQDSTEDSYVITEDHYFDYPIYDEIPVTIRRQFKNRRFLFLGYSLSDWNLRMIFRRIWRDQKLERESWTVNFKEDPVQRLFWEKRNVRYIVADLQDYIHDLTLKLLFAK